MVFVLGILVVHFCGCVVMVLLFITKCMMGSCVSLLSSCAKICLWQCSGLFSTHRRIDGDCLQILAICEIVCLLLGIMLLW